MSAINEAIFRGQRRAVQATESYDTIRRSHGGLTGEFIARKAVEAVLAGGYTKCEAETQGSIEAHRAAPPERSRFARDAALWACLFALAGLMGLGVSRVARGTVQAKPADRAAALSRDEARAEENVAAMEETAPAETEAAATEEAAKPAMTRVKVALPAPPQPAITIAMKPEVPAPAATQVSVALRPVSRAAFAPAAPTPIVIHGTPDDQPIGSPGSSVATAASAPAGGGVQLDEVLYEGEPATAAASAPSGAGMARRAITVDSGDEEKASAKRGGKADTGGMPRIEGIFYDKVRPMAIINGDIVEVGKPVGAMKVAEIRPGVVVLSDSAGVRFELRP